MHYTLEVLRYLIKIKSNYLIRVANKSDKLLEFNTLYTEIECLKNQVDELEKLSHVS